MRRIAQPSLSARPQWSSQDEKAQSNKLRGGDSGVLCQRGSGWEGRTTRTTRTSRTSRCTGREGSGGEVEEVGKGEGGQREEAREEEGGRQGREVQASWCKENFVHNIWKQWLFSAFIAA